MSITDELRKVAAKTECANGRCEKLYRGDLEHIADRIDAAHERDVTMARGEAVTELGHKVVSEYVKLPVSEDGETIHVGDTLDGYGKTIEVVELRYGRSGWVLISRDGNGYADTFAFAHHHAPTVEDVLRAMLDALDVDVCDDPDATIAEYAKRLRLAGEDE